MTIKTIAIIILAILMFPSSVLAQPFRLSVPLLEGRPAPFSGLLITEEHAIQCVEDSASVERLTVELAARTQELTLSSSLRDTFIEDQRDRIRELSKVSWWDKHGNVFMLGVGFLLGIISVSLAVGLSS